jgi:hypothetical protein
MNKIFLILILITNIFLINNILPAQAQLKKPTVREIINVIGSDDLSLFKKFVNSGLNIKSNLESKIIGDDEPLIKPLFFIAIESSAKNIADFMLKSGVNVDIRDSYGNTALANALMFPIEIDMIKFLLQNGADVNAINAYGRSILAKYLDARSYCPNFDIQKDILKTLLLYGANYKSNEIYERLNKNQLKKVRKQFDEIIPEIVKEYTDKINEYNSNEPGAIPEYKGLEILENIVKIRTILGEINPKGQVQQQQQMQALSEEQKASSAASK